MVHLRDFALHCENAANGIAEAVCEASRKNEPLIIDKGVWKTGPVDISVPVRIIFEDGAVLSMIPSVRLYRPCFTRWEGVDCYGFHPCFLIHDTSDVEISGNGIIEGNGSWWWETAEKKRNIQMEPVTDEEKELAALNPGFREMEGGGRESQFLRPDLFQIYNCRNISVSDITLQNSPFWTLHPVYSSSLDISSVSVRNPYDSPNTDGINIDSCHGVRVHGCTVDVGDDGISMKSGCNESGIRRALPTHDVEVCGCTVLHAHGGIVIGSDSSGGVHDVSVHDCRFIGTDRGVRLKTRRGRGGDVHDISISDIDIDGCLAAFTVNMYYRCGAYNPDDFSLNPRPVTERTPHIHDIVLRRIKARECKSMIGFIAGLPESRADGIIIEDSSFSLASSGLESSAAAEMYSGLPEYDFRGVRIRHGELIIRNTEINLPEDERMLIEDGGSAVFC